MLSRRDFLWRAGATAAMTGWAGRGLQAASWSDLRPVGFDIVRGGSLIGHHTTRFEPDGPRLVALIEIRIKVTFAGIPVFRYEHDNREVWADGRLVAIDSRTNDDGDAFKVSGRQDGGKFVVDGAAGRVALPADVMPTSYWQPGFAQRRDFLDSQRGILADFQIAPGVPDTIEVQGRPMPANRHEVSGRFPMTLWYLKDGDWAKLIFPAKGSEIVYLRRAVPA